MNDRDNMTLETAKKILTMHFFDDVPSCSECPAYADPVCKGPCEAVKCVLDHLDKAMSAVQKWVPASEPPKEPGEYSVKIREGTEATTLFWDGQEWFDVVEDEVICYNISAWMPLPEPPKEDEHGPAE